VACQLVWQLTKNCGACVFASRQGPDSEGERPKKDESQESQGCRTWRNPATAASTGRGIKPLKRSRCGSNAHAPKALERQGPRGTRPRALSEEQVFGTANLGRRDSKS